MGQPKKKTISLIQQSYPDYSHIYDYVHIIKNLRNLLLERTLRRGNVKFNIAILKYLCEKYREIGDFITADDIHPTDKMAIAPVVKLLDAVPLFSRISAEDAAKEPIVEFINYVTAMRQYYISFNSNDDSSLNGNFF